MRVNSSFLVRIAGKTLLIDPVFENAGPVSFVGQRFQESVLARKYLPPIDYVLISHDHYDHLEIASFRGKSTCTLKIMSWPLKS